MKFKAVIFDLYGTLVDNFSARAHEEVLRKMASIIGAPPDDFVRLWFESYDWRAIGKMPEDTRHSVVLAEMALKNAIDFRRPATTMPPA